MVTYQDLKSVAYLNEIIAYVQNLLNIRKQMELRL